MRKVSLYNIYGANVRQSSLPKKKKMLDRAQTRY